MNSQNRFFDTHVSQIHFYSFILWIINVNGYICFNPAHFVNSQNRFCDTHISQIHFIHLYYEFNFAIPKIVDYVIWHHYMILWYHKIELTLWDWFCVITKSIYLNKIKSLFHQKNNYRRLSLSQLLITWYYHLSQSEMKVPTSFSI